MPCTCSRFFFSSLSFFLSFHSFLTSLSPSLPLCRLADYQVKKGQLNRARRGYVAALKLCPTYELAWERLLDLEEKHNPDQVRLLLFSALTHLPESSSLQRRAEVLHRAPAPRPPSHHSHK